MQVKYLFIIKAIKISHIFLKYIWLSIHTVIHTRIRASLVAHLVKNPPAVQPRFNSWVGKTPWRRDSLPTPVFLGVPGGSVGKRILQCGRPEFNPWVGKIPWKRAWQPTLVFLPGESPWTEEPGGLQSWGCMKLDTTEANHSTVHTHIDTHTHTHTHTYT